MNSKVVSCNNKLTLLDIGARDGVEWPWDSVSRDELNIILVEPDPDEVKRLEGLEQGLVLPYALWNEETELILNINNSPATSSIFEANIPFLKQFEDVQRFKVKKKIAINTKTIDGLSKIGEIDSVDFVKLDVQGGELAILQGGENFLKKEIIGLEVETEFAPIYKDQPLFNDVDSFVRERLGMELFDIRKVYWKYKQKKYRPPLKGRLIFADSLYLRPIPTLDEWLSKMDKEMALKKLHALIGVSIAYGFLDYTFAILEASFSKKYLTKEERKVLTRRVNNIPKGFYPFKNGNKILYRIFGVLTHIFKSTYKGWGTGDPHLGSRKRSFFWY
jgi:FkbM family methyltransferase